MPTAFSGSYIFSLNTTLTQVLPHEEITVEFVSETLPTSRNYTASLGVGSLTFEIPPPLHGAYPFATCSITYGNFITGTETPDTLVLNASLSSFYGSDYLQIPQFESGSADSGSLVTNSLYPRYLDINYPFHLDTGDKIVIKSADGRVQEATVSSVVTDSGDGLIRIVIQGSLNAYFIDNPEKIDTFLAVKKLKDEQNIILQFKKPPGETSYGFIISDDVDPKLIQNISTIQTNVQTQLLSTQNTGQKQGPLDLGTF